MNFFTKNSQEIPDTAKMVCRELALDWIFFELSADMFGNSYDMQQKFDHYIPDYNGQSPYTQAHMSLARKFIETYGDESLPKEERKMAVDAEYVAFKTGVALELLTDDLMRRGLVGREAQARRITSTIGEAYPSKLDSHNFSWIEPFSRPELIERVGLLKPRKNIRHMNLELGNLVADVILYDK